MKKKLILLSILLFFVSWICLELREFPYFFSDQNSQELLLQFRLPRLMIAIFAGSSLALAALILQSYLKNPLAGASTLGISSGSSFMVALSTMGLSVFGLSPFWGLLSQVGASFLGASAVMMFLLFLNQFQRVPTTHLLLFGVMLSAFLESLTGLILWNSSAESVKGYLTWGMGSFEYFNLDFVKIVIPLWLLGLVFAFKSAKGLDLLILGQNSAESLGLKMSTHRFAVLLATSILAATITAFCGPIAFLGMATPHLVRWIFGPMPHFFMMIFCLLLGAILAVFSAMLTAVFEGQLPLQTITALWGAPVMMVVLWKNRASRT